MIERGNFSLVRFKIFFMLAIRYVRQNLNVLTEAYRLRIETTEICFNSGSKYVNALISGKSLQIYNLSGQMNLILAVSTTRIT